MTRTGGLPRLDDLGHLRGEEAEGKRVDLTIAAGYKVWPREVENILYTHAAVREAAVVGMADEYRGETVEAFVSMHAGATSNSDELIAFCRERMAAYKYPRAVEIVDELPKNAAGKILRRELRAPASGS